ncbi:MAG: type IX secretion system sortase PorU [candidate division Zixibacteria bacterium]
MLKRNALTYLVLIVLSFTGNSICRAESSANAHYPDFEIDYIADNHISIKYSPLYSNDYSSIRRLARHNYNGKEVLGRSVLVVVPEWGEMNFTFNFKKVGALGFDNKGDYVSEQSPLVVKHSEFMARGHRIVRFLIFPQRIEETGLGSYDDFAIDVYFEKTARSSSLVEKQARLDSLLARTVINDRQFFSFGASRNNMVVYKPVESNFGNATKWLKIAVDEYGVYRITGSDLVNVGVNLSGLSSDSLRLFYGGGKNPPIGFSESLPELYEIPVDIIDGGDGVFNSGDYILFYGQAVNRYDYFQDPPGYIRNIYNRLNYYWLAVGGDHSSSPLRWRQIVSENGTPDLTLNNFRQLKMVEQDHDLRVDSDGHIRNYYTWYWSNMPNVTASFSLDNPAPDDIIEIEMAAIANFSGSSLVLNGTEMTRTTGSGTVYKYEVNSDAGSAGLNTAQVSLQPNIRGTYLDYLSVNYPQILEYANPQLAFSSFTYSGLIKYHIANVGQFSRVLDITLPDDPAIIENMSLSGDTAEFQMMVGDDISRFVLFSEYDVLQPEWIRNWEGENLRNDISQYDCIIVGPGGFAGAVDEYVSYRQGQGYSLKPVAVEDIYDQFGFGLESPLAIRNYLKFAYENFASPAPYAVLLVGDGHYDFLDNMEHHSPSYMPPFIWEFDHSAGDDNFVYFGDFAMLDSDSSYVINSDRGWDMMVARWPVRSSYEVSSYIEKVKRYESEENQGIWRSKVTFVADDEFKSNYTGEIIHTAQAETLAVFHTPPEITKQKIYATEYSFASSGEKPMVNDAIVKTINEGTLIINYIGHGSPDVWADEHIFKKNSDLGRLRNLDKPVIVIAGSCSIGKFDQPSKEGMAEMIFRQENGAIETVSATRLVYSRDNAIFSYDLYDAVFGGSKNITEAVFAAKLLHQYERSEQVNLLRNDRSYVVFGDPLGDMGIPEYKITINPTSASTLVPLENFEFSGEVVDNDDNIVVVDGLVNVDVYDSRFVRHHPMGMDYSLGGPRIFSGVFEVSSGRFEGGFIVPLDIDYGGNAAQISCFGSFGIGSALGCLDSIEISQNAGTTTDNDGPVIEYTFEENPDFVNGGRIPSNATLVLNIADNSGINLTGGLGHRIELTIDNDNNSTLNLTDYFAYNQGSYQEGQISYRLPELTPEKHIFRVKVWDNANNPGIIEFEVLSSQAGSITIHNVLNYPNPMEESTEFYFELSEPAEWAELKIFTLAGRQIKTLRETDLNCGRNRRFFWNGRDLDSDRIAEGVYLYKITVKGKVFSSGRTTDNLTEAFGKLVLLN